VSQQQPSSVADVMLKTAEAMRERARLLRAGDNQRTVKVAKALRALGHLNNSLREGQR